MQHATATAGRGAGGGLQDHLQAGGKRFKLNFKQVGSFPNSNLLDRAKEAAITQLIHRCVQSEVGELPLYCGPGRRCDAGERAIHKTPLTQVRRASNKMAL